MAALSLRARTRLRLVGLLSPVSLVIGLFFLTPLAIMATYSLLEPGLYGGVEWNFYPDNFGRVLGWADGTHEEFDIVYLEIILRSLRIALLTVVASLLICYPVAFWVSRLDERKRNFFLFLITLPFFASLIVRLYAWVLILRPTGFLNHFMQALGLSDRPLDLIYSETAVLIGLVYIFIPFMFLPIYASVEKLDRRLLEASQDLGASRLQTFWRVILPLTLPGVAAGSLIVFIPSLGNFIVPSLLGGAKVLMIGSLVEQQFLAARNWPFGAALAMLLMAAVLLFLLIYVRHLGRGEVRA
ncbi:ABC transporter permease [Zestomonas carbonaria]|uniref:Spermidine/putrescine transport system permease protein PotB n=1 Tax=Zestomonas carbonaria TaxID=2762745 RepID=A0A7U7EJ43_9GAMM|nr:ABC transporter permease [Pseudomonas carbonaria]CAD5105949.1 Spermidine/putrescine transport system permease protein PotB [Pseudomonas carbonaria]